MVTRNLSPAARGVQAILQPLLDEHLVGRDELENLIAEANEADCPAAEQRVLNAALNFSCDRLERAVDEAEQQIREGINAGHYPDTYFPTPEIEENEG